jgi:hypothetical protein
LRTDSPNTSIYLTRIDYTSTSESPIWSLQTNPSHTTLLYPQIIFGGSTSSDSEGSLYVVVGVGTRYQVSRVRFGGIQWTYEFPLDINNPNTQVFIDYALNAIAGGANTLVVSNS